jgi:hypothetical protein
MMLAGGALEHDRRFALRDTAGEFINGKRFPIVHRLRSFFNPAQQRFTLRAAGDAVAHEFHVYDQRSQLTDWLSQYFEMPLGFVENPTAGFPDDTESPGPTVISTATLATVAAWFGGLSVDEVRGRFRANLEIDGVEPFWEDRLVAEQDRVVRFRIGQAELLGTNPCQRCIVPTRHPQSGEIVHGFSKEFARRRRETLPAWAATTRFDHFYRLAVNTRPAHARSCMLHVGDEVNVVGVE